MNNKLKFCPRCNETKENYTKVFGETAEGADFFKGFLNFYIIQDENICPCCNNPGIIDTGLTKDEFRIIAKGTSENRQVLEAMIDLKQKDPIDYQLKLNQFKLQVEQQEALKKQEENKLHCPRCNSTSVTVGERGFSLFSGFLGSNKTMNRCGNCGYKWAPKK